MGSPLSFLQFIYFLVKYGPHARSKQYLICGESADKLRILGHKRMLKAHEVLQQTTISPGITQYDDRLLEKSHF